MTEAELDRYWALRNAGRYAEAEKFYAQTQVLADHDADARSMYLEHIVVASETDLHDLLHHTTDRVVEMAVVAELQARMASRFQADYPDRLGR